MKTESHHLKLACRILSKAAILLEEDLTDFLGQILDFMDRAHSRLYLEDNRTLLFNFLEIFIKVAAPKSSSELMNSTSQRFLSIVLSILNQPYLKYIPESFFSDLHQFQDKLCFMLKQSGKDEQLCTYLYSLHKHKQFKQQYSPRFFLDYAAPACLNVLKVAKPCDTSPSFLHSLTLLEILHPHFNEEHHFAAFLICHQLAESLLHLNQIKLAQQWLQMMIQHCHFSVLNQHPEIVVNIVV